MHGSIMVVDRRFGTNSLLTSTLSRSSPATPVCRWAGGSIKRSKLIYRRIDNLRAVQLLLDHSKIESTVRYLGIEVDDAIAIFEKVDV